MRVRIVCREARFDARKAASQARAAGERGLARAGEYVRARAVDIMPRRSGAMAASTRVVAAAGRATVRCGAPYAAIQHEHAEFRHPNGGRAGFLRAAIEAPKAARELERALAEELRAQF